jgi:hypothetical protein
MEKETEHAKDREVEKHVMLGTMTLLQNFSGPEAVRS